MVEEKKIFYNWRRDRFPLCVSNLNVTSMWLRNCCRVLLNFEKVDSRHNYGIEVVFEI